MAAKFIDLLQLPELDIGHSKKVLFTSDHFHSSSTASKANAPFTFLMLPRKSSDPGC